MKKSLFVSLVAATALSAFGTVAYAQLVKPNLPFKKPALTKAPPGVKLASLDVSGKCGAPTAITVKVSYSNLVAPVTTMIWGSVGEKQIELPTGSGTKSYDFTGPTLVCGGAGQNWQEALIVWVYLADSPSGLSNISFTSSGVPVPIPGLAEELRGRRP